MSLMVELVYNGDCPNAEEARINVRRALSEAGRAVQWTEWEASSDATPVHQHGGRSVAP